MRIRFRLFILILGLTVFLAPVSKAQDNADRISRIQDNINNTKAKFDQLPDDVKRILTTEHRRWAHLAEAVNRMAPSLVKDQGKKFSSGWQPSQGWEQGEADENGLVQVNNPARDLRFSPFLGFTQDNAVTARCGDNVVVAFEDSASTVETLFTGQGGVSFIQVASGTGGISSIGYATSHNGGESFKDRGAVNPGPDVDTFLFVEPSVACSDPNHFYLVVQGLVSSGDAGKTAGGHLSPVRAILLSQSSDGGETWSDPATIVAPDTSTFLAFSERFSDPWIAIDPSNHQRVYISYIHLDLNVTSVDNPDCTARSQVEVVSSADGGRTFDPTPRVLDSQCFLLGGFIDMGTRMAISSTGRVTVAWEGAVDLGGFIQQAILVNSFVPGGPTPASVIVDNVVPGGSAIAEPLSGFGPFPDPVGVQNFTAFALQGGIYNQRGFDLAVDHSGGPTDGLVYLLWDDSRNGFGLVPEFEDIDIGANSFTDILYAVSADGGLTFAPTRQLNSGLQTSGLHDHFRPVAAVDSNGTVAACWYDRRNDPQNYQFERFCAESKNAGGTWTEFRVPGSVSTPAVMQDILFGSIDSMGENDNLTTDFSRHAPGFIGGIQWMSSGMNPDVKEVRFR